MIEVDRFDHCDRDIEYEKERERRLKEELSCVFIKINLDAVNFNCFKAINKIHRHISKSTREMDKKETEKFIIDDKKKLLKEGSTKGSEKFLVDTYFPL